MSKANNPVKVLRTALKRVQKGWTKNNWHYHSKANGGNFVCLEGAVYGYCNSEKHQVTPAQKEAIRVLREIIKEKYGHMDIPSFNDASETTKENVMEVIKLGMIRLETGGGNDDDEEWEFLEELEEQPSGG